MAGGQAIRSFGLACVAMACISIVVGCAPANDGFGAPNGTQFVRVEVSGARSWTAEGSVEPGFVALRTENWVLGRLTGSVKLVTAEGETLKVKVDLSSVAEAGNLGSVVVTNETIKRSANGLVASSPRIKIESTPAGGWLYTIRAEWLAFYQGKPVPGSIVLIVGHAAGPDAVTTTSTPTVTTTSTTSTTTTSTTSTTTTTTVEGAPLNVGPPTLSGTAAVGATMTAGAGTWEGPGPIEVVPTLSACSPDLSECVDRNLSDASTYRVGAADIGSVLALRETASNATSTVTVTTMPSTAVKSPEGVVVEHCGDIAADTAWAGTQIHVLTCPVGVPDGVTLTVEAGGAVLALCDSPYQSLVLVGELDARADTVVAQYDSSMFGGATFPGLGDSCEIPDDQSDEPPTDGEVDTEWG